MNDSRWGTWWAKVAAPAGPGELLISEFRLRGPNGANDEFIEIYNNSGSAHTVNSSDGSAGYAVAASDGVVRFTIPNGTVIPAKGHYLGVNSVGYSLASYPAGNGTTATEMLHILLIFPTTPVSHFSQQPRLQTFLLRLD